MIAKIIEFSIRNRFIVIAMALGVVVWGVYAVIHTPVDAIPDLSENQVIVFTDWMGAARGKSRTKSLTRSRPTSRGWRV